jgi:predicted transglutaminase-like cysteine proteinase
VLTRITWLLLLALSALAAKPLQALPSLPDKAASAPNAFGSVALPLGPNKFSERWRRVASAGSSARLSEIIAPARALDATRQARFVNAALNHKIEFQPERGDRWSTPAETLGSAAGDCEDYAVAKMHALKQLGVNERDLFLTVGQDTATRQAHAVLLMRAGNRFWVMDNRSDRLIPDSQFRDFTPMVSFRADGKSWLHGMKHRLRDPDVNKLLPGHKSRLREPDISDLLAA